MPVNVRHIRLQIGIAIAFLLIFVPAMAVVIFIFYAKTAQSADDIAAQLLDRVSISAISQTGNLLLPVKTLVDTVVGFAEVEPDALTQARMTDVLYNIVREYPQLYSLYMGFKADGSFVEIIRIPHAARNFGPNNHALPAGAVFVVRRIDRATGSPVVDRWTYLTGDGQTVGTETATQVDYDPRSRVYYTQAMDNPGHSVLSDPYLFASTKGLGVSISRSIEISGEPMGVVGADISLDGFSTFLQQAAPSEHGLAMIIDDQGRLIGYPSPQMSVRQTPAGFVIVRARDMNNGAIRQLAAGHRYTGSVQRYDFHGPDRTKMFGGTEYVASFTPFPTTLGKKWELVLVVPKDDFVGSLRQTVAIVLSFTALVFITGLIAIRVLSMNMTRAIDQLIEETDRLRRLDLGDGPPKMIASRITEIRALSDAMAAMRVTLESFVRFVPRTLVKDLVATGRGLSLGGESRAVTVMFTDLANFSTVAEQVPAQELTLRVSEYLQAVSEEVIACRGTIDKYVGDAVMALWNAPQREEDHIALACLAALQATRRMEQVNDRWAAEGWRRIGMRIGLHTDNVVVGIIGSTEHMGYTALGDGVNIAARLEGVNKIYGTAICVSEPIYRAVHDRFVMRRIDEVVVNGRSEPIAIYELMGTLSETSEVMATLAQQEQAALTNDAFKAWASYDYPAAGRLYRELSQRFPADPVATLYLRRCAQVLRETMS